MLSRLLYLKQLEFSSNSSRFGIFIPTAINRDELDDIKMVC